MRTRHTASRRFKKTALCAALGLCLASGIAYGQSNTSGTLFGQANQGDTILVENTATGFKREIVVPSGGSYRAAAVPVGTYRVTVQRADGTTSVRENVTVSVGTGTSVNFASAEATLDTIEVSAGRINAIDVSSVESTTVLTSEQIAKIPVGRDLTSVALLAPGTVKGDAAFGNLASFGGSSVAENQYFVNGFNVTNTFKNLNFFQVPFEGVAEQQTKTGGYGAEFGRSTGGVVNVVTKRGTNEFTGGANAFWLPESLSETNPNYYYNTGALGADNSKDNGWSYVTSAWAGGALVQDRLFMYGLVSWGQDQTNSYPGSAAGTGVGGSNTEANIDRPTWLLKMDWSINDSNLVEFTGFSTTAKTETDYYATQFGNPGSPDWTPIRTNYKGTAFTETGGDGYVLRYTGYLTDTFTLSALGGYGEFQRNQYGVAANGVESRYTGNLFGDVPGCPVITDSRPLAVRQATGTIVGCNFVGTLGRPNNKDTREQFRVDADWQLGDHLVRFGYDADDFESVDGNAREGGYTYQYAQSGGQDFVRRTNFRNAATVKVEQQAFYIEDSWNVSDTFVAYLGLRWDTFENKNGLGETYVKQDNQLGPRLGFSWDVTGDQTNKIYANAGRYALPLTSNVAVRGASASIYEIQDFTYTGRDPLTQAPIGLTPFGALGYGDPFFANGEAGTAKDPRAIAATNLDPMYQDEYILGFQHQFSESVSGGVRGVYRDLKRAIDDVCDITPFLDYAEENGLEAMPANPAFPYCRLFNPGEDGNFNVDIDGDGTLENVTVDADAFGPRAKRSYSAIETFFEASFDRLFLMGSYTWSKSYGNTEGGVKSDIGQSDTGVTQDFDYPSLTIGSNGYLPNDRRHSIKVFGNYELTEEWSIGANALLQSGRPQNCIGIYDDDPAHYRVAYFSCDAGEPPTGSLDNGATVVPRGSVGRNPWTYTFDLNVAYRPSFAEGLQFKVDVFNIFDEGRLTSVDEDGESSTGSPSQAAPTYLTPLTWQAPRQVRLMVQYDF